MAISEKILPTFLQELDEANSVIELGNQEFLNPNLTLGERSVKSFCEKLGKAHVSIDITGFDRSLNIDLSKDSIPFIQSADLVTNFGTSEHIDESQFNAFKHIHDLCKVDGRMLHEVPAAGHWPNHCRYYYDEEFFNYLASTNTYEIVRLGRINYEGNGDLMVACLVKKSAAPFACILEEFNQLIKETANPVRVNEYWRYYL